MKPARPTRAELLEQLEVARAKGDRQLVSKLLGRLMLTPHASDTIRHTKRVRARQGREAKRPSDARSGDPLGSEAESASGA